MMSLCKICKNTAERRAAKEGISYYMCKACSLTFCVEEKSLSNEASVVAAKEKVQKYLETHKSPVTVSDLAKRFELKETTIATALSRLERERIAIPTRVGNRNFWQLVRTRVAVPKTPTDNVKFIPQHVKQSSYANIRGYDD